MIIGTAHSRTEVRPASFRWRAFGIHLGISLTVLGALLYVLFYNWFPGYLFDTDGGWQALRVIAGVDIILGPLLTLIAANPVKSTRELRMDFTLIGIIQVCALSAGTWLAWDNRPYAMLWYDGVVYSLPWSALRDEESALEGIRQSGNTLPIHRRVVDMPLEPLARDAVIQEAERIGTEPLLYGRRYLPWPPAPRLTQAFSTIAIEMAAEQSAALASALANTRKGHPAAVLVPVRSRYADYFLAMDPATGETLEAILITPNARLVAGAYPLPRLRELLR